VYFVLLVNSANFHYLCNRHARYKWEACVENCRKPPPPGGICRP
jgi:hypothetical protein